MPLTVLVFMNFEKYFFLKNTLPYGINIKYVKKKTTLQWNGIFLFS